MYLVSLVLAGVAEVVISLLKYLILQLILLMNVLVLIWKLAVVHEVVVLVGVVAYLVLAECWLAGEDGVGLFKYIIIIFIIVIISLKRVVF